VWLKNVQTNYKKQVKKLKNIWWGTKERQTKRN